MEIHDTENNKMIDISTNERRKQKDINKSISRRKRRNFTDDIKEQQTYITEKIFNKAVYKLNRIQGILLSLLNTIKIFR